MTRQRALVTLLPSTDCDLGRWLLQHYGIEYVEHPHAPIMHVLALKYYGVGKDDYPLLLESDGGMYPTVPHILERYELEAAANLKLLPDDPEDAKAVHAAAHDFRMTMGIGVVNWAYWHFLPHKNLNWASFTTGVPWWEKLFVWGCYPLLKFLMIKGLGLNADKAAKGLETIREYFDQVEARLADGREFLYCDRLTYADLAFAVNAGPMVLANGYGGHLPPEEDCPPEMQAVIQELRARPAGQYAQKIYNRYRLGTPSKTVPDTATAAD